MFDVRLRQYSPAGVRGAVLPTLSIDAVDGAASIVSASVSKRVAGNLTAPFVVALEYNVGDAWIEVRNGRMVVNEDDMQDAGDLTQVVSFAGRPQVAWQLTKALAFPATFTNVSVGAILVPLLTQAQGRGWGPGVTWAFTGTVDSQGRTWPTADKISVNITETTTIAAILDSLATQGLVEWWTEGLQLVVALPKVGVDHSVDIVLGPGATRSPRRTSADIVTHLTVIPEGVDRFVMTNIGALGDFGRLEGMMTQSGVSDRPTAEKLAQPALDDAKGSIADQSVEYPASKAPALPWADYAVGDSVSTKQGAVSEVRRVVEFAVSKSVEGLVTVTTTTGHRFRSPLSKVHEIAAAGAISSNAGGLGGTLPPTSAPADKTDPPTPPTLRSFQSSVLVKSDGLLTTGEPPVGFKAFIAEASPNGTTGWVAAATEFVLGEAEFPASLVGVGAAETVHVRLRAVNTKGVLSDPSTVASITVEGVKATDLDAAVSDAVSDATATADSAFALASGRNKITYASTTPVGSGTAYGDTWYQRTGGIIVGIWEWTAGSPDAWVARTVDNATIANLNAGKLTAGFLDVGRLAASSISTGKLLVGNFENQVNDSSFEANTAEAWTLSNGATNAATNPRTGSRALTSTYVAAGQIAIQTAAMSVIEGERYRIGMWVRTASGSSNTGGIGIGFMYGATESTTTTSHANRVLTPNGAGTTYTFVFVEWTVPAGAKYARLVLTRNDTAATVYQVDDIVVQKKVTGELIVDGAVTALKISGDAIDGKTITGATLQSDAAAVTGVKFTSAGIYGYSPGGVLKFSLNAGSGVVTMVDANLSGAFYSGESGGIGMQGSQEATKTPGTPLSSYKFKVEAGVGASTPLVDSSKTGVGGMTLNAEVNSSTNQVESVTILAAAFGATAADTQAYGTSPRADIALRRKSVPGSSGNTSEVVIDGQLITLNGRVAATHLACAESQGRTTITPSAANTATAASVTFPGGRFTLAPGVTASVSSPLATVGVSAITTSGFTATIIRSNTTNTVVIWQAMQMSDSNADG